MADDRTQNDAQRAAAMAADVGVEHVADVYAEALLGAAAPRGYPAGQTEAVLDELDDLVAEVLDPNLGLERILSSALVSHDEKAGVLDRVLGGRASPLMLRFLKVVSRHGRLDCLRAIHRQARGLYETSQGRVVVEVTSAVPVDDALADEIVRGIRPLLGGEPVLRRSVDPKLIGGIVVRVGDTVYDGSIAAQLNSAREQMIDRSAHEIQSRRDRFRYPAGN